MDKEIIEKIVALTNNGVSNREIAVQLGLKYSTVCYFKMRLKDRGVQIKSNMGRPKKVYETI